MVNGINGISAQSRTASRPSSANLPPLDLKSVETRHAYEGTQDRKRLFDLPTAPTYRPSEAEFVDPLLYIEKISSHAKKYGICKIIPPNSWRPGFAINTERFQFRTRKQELNSMEAKCRASLNYIDQLFKFHQQNGTPMRGIPTLDGKPMNLCQLRDAVESLGGYNKVNNSGRSPTIRNLWADVGKEFGFSDNPTMCTSLAPNFKSVYQRYILPYESFLYRERPKVINTPPKMITAVKEEQPAVQGSSLGESQCSSPEQEKNQKRQLELKPTRSSKRQKRESLKTQSISPSPKKVATVEVKPGENCETCGRGDDGVHMLLCDGCEAGYHIYCLDPPLAAVPKIDWYCSKCLVGTGEFGFEEGGTYSLAEFRAKADAWKAEYFKTQNQKSNHEVSSVTEYDVEREFWRLVQDVNDTTEVEYGADIHSSIHGSAFPTLERNPLDDYSYSPWNLNNLPLLDESLLRYIKTDISGMTVPWLYVGMCFSTFCWHNEDHYTYSINYQHFGEAKTWYGIPGDDACKFEEVMRQAVPELFEQQPDLLLQLVTIFSPERLVKEGVSVYGCDQHAGEFVVTFPQAYHAGFNQGFNFNEAVNFALPDWVSSGLSKDCVVRYKQFARQPVFSHDELLITAALYDDSIRTAVWLAPAMEELVMREVNERKAFIEANPEIMVILSQDDVPEEQYMCGVCKILTYLSQITCSCTKKITCLEHMESLCDCEPNKHVLRMRFPNYELEQLLRKLQERAKLPFAWKHKFFATLKEGPTPHIKVLRQLLSEGDKIAYPLEERETLRDFVNKVNEWIEIATPLLTKKTMNTGRRKSDKLLKKMDEEAQIKLQEQRHPDFPDKLVAEAKKLAFDSHEIQALQEKSEAIRKWRADARSLMALPQISIDSCHEIIESGQALNVDLPEVGQFVTYVTQLKWLEEARPSFDKAIPLEDVIRMWDAGKACGVPVAALEMHKLDLRRQAGEAWEEQAARMLTNERVPVNQVSQALAQAQNICITTTTAAKLNAMLARARHMQEEVANFNARTKEESYAQRPTMAEYTALQDKIDALQTRFAEGEKLSQCAKTLNDWIRHGKRLFGKSNAPLDIFGQHLDYVIQRNAACLSLDDGPRDPVEPASREATPEPNLSQPAERAIEAFCMCRQPEAGLMLECDVCHEWYHGKCLKVIKKDLKTNNNYVCPICDWREEIPRPSHRPRLQDMQALFSEGQKLPLQTPELSKLESILSTAIQFKERVMPLLNSYLTLTSAELSTLKFYLRKLEGAEILLAEEVNFFRSKIHELHPIAPQPPPKIEESRSTRKPRLSKKKKEELEAQGIDPSTYRARPEPVKAESRSPSPSPDPIVAPSVPHITQYQTYDTYQSSESTPAFTTKPPYYQEPFDLISSAMKQHGSMAQEPDDASYLLDFANQASANLPYDDPQEVEIMESFLIE